jgi:fibronectin type 3 domain-containing protein
MSRPRRTRSFSAAIALGTVTGLIGSLIAAAPAMAITRAEVNPDPVQWAATPYSPLPWAQLVPPANGLQLGFDGDAGGLPDGSTPEVGTGFPMVLPSSAAGSSPYFVPENLSVSGGKLNILTTPGIAFSTNNTQDNTIGVPLDTAGSKYYITTTLTSPATMHSSAQGGLWFGIDDKNYVKLAVIGNGNATTTTGNRQIQFAKEVNEATAGLATGATSGADQIVAATTQSALGSNPIKLELVVDAIAGTVTGSYTIGSAAAVTMGTLSGVPASFFNGSTLVGKPAANPTGSFAGVYATKRNFPVATPLTFSFDEFAVAEIDSTPTAAPSGLEADPGLGKVGLTWQAPTDADLAGYRVYRSTSTPVALTGTPLSGTALLAEPKFTDTQTFGRVAYHYAIVAVDETSNVSPAATAGPFTADAPDAEPLVAFDFTMPLLNAAQGYTKDEGAPYSAARGFGWKNAAGTPVDISTLTRDRAIGGVEGRLNTFVHMHPNTPGTGDLAEVPYRWQYDLPDGTYTVVVAAGDSNPGQNGYDSTHVLRAEGTPILDAFKPSAARQYDEAILTDVVVADGALTIDAVGGINTKLAYVEIYRQELTAPDAPANLSSTLTGKDVTLEWDEVENAVAYKVFRSTGESVDTAGDALATVATTSYADTATAWDTTYRYAVVAVTKEGTESEPSGTETVVVPEFVDPNPPQLCQSSEWKVEYFSGTALAGQPLDVTCAIAIDQSYTGGAHPEQTPAATNYSIRWTKTIDQGAGSYQINTRTDDGVRVKVDGQVVVNRWFAQAADATFTTTVPLSAGPHKIEVEYYQSFGDASARVTVQKTTSVCAPTEWRAEYFNGTGLSGSPVADSCVSAIDQSFASGQAPVGLADKIGTDLYSIRWSRTINEGAGTYEFRARTDDGVRIFVDGAAVLDEWYDQSAEAQHVEEVKLSAGSHQVIVEYYQGYNEASAKVEYERTSFDSQAPDVPTGVFTDSNQLFIGVKWQASASSDVAGYRVYRSETPTVATTGTPLNGNTLLAGLFYNDTSAQPDVEYWYAVVAVDETGNASAGSTAARGYISTAPDTEAPAAPTELKAVAGDASVALNWKASGSADTIGYRVFRGTEPAVATTGTPVSGAAPVTGNTFTDATVTNGTTYFYVVVAVDLAGNASAASNEVVAVPLVPNTTNVKVDFTATNGTPAAGYYADWGQAYGVRTGATQGSGAVSYGWMTQDGNTLSLVGNGRDRGRAGVPELVDSMIHMQYGDVDGGNGTNGVKVDGVWEVAVPDGLYEVTLAVGDEPGATNPFDSEHVINVEGSVGIEKFVGSAAAEYRTITTKVGVWDGRLTIDAVDGFNTKLGYIEVKGLERAPHVDTVLPENRVTGHDVNAGVSATIKVPYAGVGLDPDTLDGNVHLYHAGTGVEIPTTVGSSGGNDVISLAPDQPLASNTQYRFVVTSGVKDGRGAAFVPFTSLFTTGTGETTTPGEFTPVTGVEFEKVELPTARGIYWSSYAFGPDGKLYANSIGQGLWRFPVNADGTLGTGQNLGYEGVAQIGLLFDKSATADNLKLWVTRTSANFSEQGQWVSSIHLLSGPNLATDRAIFTSLPRSLSDHLTNSMVYGPDGKIYFQQGSNQASGDLDNAWGQRGEQLLTAATLFFDPAHPQVQTAANGGAAIDVKTAQGGTYSPYAPNAPLKIYATGIRNAYDLVWHSNGHLYVATNGTAGGANTPGVTANANGTFTRTAAPGIPGFSTVNGQDVTSQCVRRGYTGGTVPPTGNIGTQRDLLFDVVQGGYYGHPNPERCEWVLNAGAGNAQFPVVGPTKYPAGTNPDPNYRGIAYDFEFNKSPNGTIEYRSNAFGGQLKGRLMVVRFSNNNDILFLQPDAATGKIIGAQTSVGITGVANSTIGGVDGFNDPLEIVEDPNTGNLYVNQYDRSGSDQRMYLLRVPANQQAAAIQPSVSELVFSAVKSTTSAAKTFTVTNNRTEPVQLSTALSGVNAAEFQVTGGTATIPAKGSVTVSVSFRPSATVGQKSASLQLTAGGSSVSVGLFGLTMNGIEGSNEPALNDVLGTLGYKVNVGWTNLAGGMQATAKGDEILEPLFVKAGTADPTMTPLAQYAPREDLPFGWYTGDGATADRRKLGSIDIDGYQSLLPAMSPGSTPSFDPGTAKFGFYYFSNTFQRIGYTEDRLNSPASDAHRARIYPAKNRAGVAITNAYIVAFEDASNGDYQDYLFLVTGVKPVTDTGSIDGAIKVDFTTATGDLAAGYLRDFGQAYGPRTGANQGSGLSFGWKDAQTENDVDLSVGGTAGNGRDRGTTQPDVRLDSLMHMQGGMVSNFNGNPVNAYWQIALPDGDYQVSVGVGDALPGTVAEIHQINLEEQPLINLFTPSGVAGSATRHSIASKVVTVTDGFLTVDATGGTNTKITHIDIVPVEGETPGGGTDPTNGAQVKVNFQPVGAPTPAGWTADTGAAFTSGSGFGWVTTSGTPVARPADSFRYRTAAANGIAFPTDPLLQTYAFMQTNPGPANWEYTVPNGTYEVTLSVGDAHFLDSTHSVTAEGQPVVNNFTPTATTPFQTGRRTVTVADGKLTIAGAGTNTKVNWVSIKGDGLQTPGGGQPTVRINYQPVDVPTPTGWQADTGAGYTAARGYGWLVNGQPADRSNATRNRPAATAGITFPAGDVTRQSLILAQAGAVAGVTDGVWEYALANGTYTVSVSAGDAGFLDSTHGVRAENTPLISSFTPTGTNPFATGTAQVLVTDGKLTLTPTGTNTKLNWVTIAGEAMANPAITATINGQPVGTDYNGGPATVTVAATAAGSATIATLRYQLDDGVPLDVNGPITVSAIGTHVLRLTAVDSAGRETIRTLTLVVEDIGGTVSLRNQQATRVNGSPIPGFSEDVLVMQRINSGVTAHVTIDQATVTVTNTGAKNLKITGLNLTGSQATQFQLVTPPATPLVIAPGASQNLTVKFIGTGGVRGVRTANLAISSSDPASPVTNVQLRGGYMTNPEGNEELRLQEISNLFGWTTDIGNLQNGDEMRTSALDGDEVRSFQWKRMDTTLPVSVRQLAAFHGCCTQTETVNVGGTSATHAAPYGQSILPLNSAGNPVQFTSNPTGNFNITVAGQNTANPNYMAVKTWPVYDATGDVIPGAWYVGHDYISSPNQCGIAPTNCDFQDNVYLVTNILPVASSDTTAPTAPSALTGTIAGQNVELSWTAGTSADTAGYIVERATAAAGPWTRISAATPQRSTTFTDRSVPFTDRALYRVLAVDASGNTSAASNAVDVDLTSIPNRAIRFRAGTTALTVGGNTWMPDTPYAAGGGIYVNPNVTAIGNTTDDALYLSERSDVPTFGYNVPLQPGTYSVKLHFAEIYWGATGGGAAGAGRRVFNVNFEGGANEITGLDIFARVGAMNALITTNSVAVTDGNLDIDFAATVNFPAIQAVEIVRTGDVQLPPAAPTGAAATLSGPNAQVSWTASGSTVAGYRVERATSATGPWTVIAGAGVPLATPSYLDTAVPFTTTAFYRVIAVGTSGLDSQPSAAVSLAVGALSTPTNLSAAPGTGSVALTWTAATGTGVTGYHVERATAANGPWTRVNGTAPVTGTSYTHANAPTGAAFYRVIATNAAGTLGTPTAAVSVTVSGGTPSQDIRINAGGPAVTAGGVAWLADTYFTGGKAYSNPQVTAIAGTTADVLYTTERSATTGPGSFDYNVPLPSGSYTVRLHFAEIYHGATGGGAGGTGKRVFSVNLEGGATEVTNLDLNAQVAPMTAYITSNTLDVTDGNLDIDFTSTVDQPKVSAIEILRNTVTPPAPAVPTGVAASASGANNVVTWTASANATGYHVERATSVSGPWTRLTTAPGSGTTFTDTAGSTLPVAVYRVLAVNSGGVLSAPSATATVNRTAPVQQPVRINTGGGATTVGGVAWQADSLFTGGKTYSNGSVTQIGGTTADTLYLNERSATADLGTFGYNIPLTNGTYTVKLHFAELFHGAPGGGAGGTGKRVFSVNLENGSPEVANLDLNALVAPTTAYVVTRQISVTDGNLDVDFTASVNQPTIGAIEVLPGAPVAPAAPAAPTGVGGTASGANNVVTWTASTSGVAGYHVERATSTAGPWTRVTSGPAVTGTTFTDTAGSTLPVAVYRVLALSSEGVLSTPSATATVNRQAPAIQPIRINTGGGAVSAGGVNWAADVNFSGGKSYSNPSVTAIGGTTADAVYVNERSATTNLGTFAYDIPVPNGTYTVRLHHAELYHGATGGGAGGAGKRVFSVNFEGGAVEVSGRDINAAVGPMTAYVTSHNVTVTGGVLDIDFAATVDQPSIAAIEVLAGANSTAPVPGGAAIGAAPASGGTPTTAGSAPFTATSNGFTAPALIPGTTPLLGTGSSPFQAAPVTPFAAPGAPAPGTAPLPPLAAAQPQIRNSVQPGELQLFGDDGFVVRVDVLAAFLLLALVLSTVLLRRTSLRQQLVELFDRLRPSTAN